MASRALVSGCVVATIAFVAYTRTLLPGVDLGDTGGFQAAILWPEVSARQAYPLYYALAKPFVAMLSPADPARGLNLFSAIAAALAAGLLTGAVMCVTHSAAGAFVAGLLVAFSYTFWTQAIIAEVYSLHLALVGACLVALAAWWRRPSTWRLTTFLAIYAAGFGNHLSMILLFLPFAAFLLAASERPRDLLHPRIVGLALAIAGLGALQYLPQLLAIWTSIGAPEAWNDRLAAFWFDVTKADWRESMVLGVRPWQIFDRLAMFVFDARQQFGIAGLALAAAGLAALWRFSRPWAGLVLLAYSINTAFALTYNVGDPHVFFLPGHYFTAFAAGAAVAGVARTRRGVGTAATAAALLFAIWRGYDTFPAADRHSDRRAQHLVAALTMGLDERDALFVTHLNWQVENALLYETRYRLRHVAWTRLPDVMLHLPLLVRDNHAGNRDIVLSAAAVPEVSAAFDALFPLVPDPLLPVPSMARQVAQIAPGAPYALAILPPNREDPLDEDALEDVLLSLTAGHVRRRSRTRYEVIIGRVGAVPLLHRAQSRPFREKLSLAEGELDIRLDGWVPLETFRRAGFGRIILDRRPVLTVERGVSFTVLDTPMPVYAAGIYALQPRFRIPSAGIPELALLH